MAAPKKKAANPKTRAQQLRQLEKQRAANMEDFNALVTNANVQMEDLREQIRLAQGGGEGADTATVPMSQAEINRLIKEGVEKGISEALDRMKEQSEAEATEAKIENLRLAVDDFRATLQAVGLGELTGTLDELVKDQTPRSEIFRIIRGSDAYKNRFPGMQALSAKNMGITEGEYINMERGYLETLRAYGLNDEVYGDRRDLGNYIANQVSAREFEERVSLAAQRVDEEAEVRNALAEMYGVDRSDMIGYILNPDKAVNAIQRQVRASEVAAAAQSARFQLGATREDRVAQAEALIDYTGSKSLATLRQEFGAARQLADTQSRLAAIEGQQYSDLEAVSAMIAGENEAVLASQRRAQRETARFSSMSGVSGSSLGRATGI